MGQYCLAFNLRKLNGYSSTDECNMKRHRYLNSRDGAWATANIVTNTEIQKYNVADCMQSVNRCYFLNKCWFTYVKFEFGYSNDSVIGILSHFLNNI